MHVCSEESQLSSLQVPVKSKVRLSRSRHPPHADRYVVICILEDLPVVPNAWPKTGQVSAVHAHVSIIIFDRWFVRKGYNTILKELLTFGTCKFFVVDESLGQRFNVYFRCIYAVRAPI